jgi:hypothetical protein
MHSPPTTGTPSVRNALRRGRLPRRHTMLLIAILASLPLLFVAQANAAFVITPDENGPNDVPGQKDLNLQGVDNSGLPTSVQVLWNWDEVGSSGGNTLDACSLFDTDGDNRANFAVCATAGSNPAANPVTTVYTCGDARVDRCSSQIAAVSNPQSACTVQSPSATDPFNGTGKARGASYPNDARATCTIVLADVGGASNAVLINTCSYPSQQPNSDPSDCVLVPRDALLTIVKVATPSNTSTAFPFSVDGTLAFTANAGGNGVYTSTAIPITTANNATHSVAEQVPTGWQLDSASCTGASDSAGTLSGSTISGINAAPDDTVTCTFNDSQQRGTVNVTKSGSDGGSQAGAVFTLYTGATADPANQVGTCTVDANGQCGASPSFSNLLPGQYTIDETTVPAGFTKDASLPHTFTLAAGGSPSLSFTNTAQPGSVSVSKIDDGGNPAANATFSVYSPAGTSNGVPTGSLIGSCVTDIAGSCTISGLAAGSYTIDETPAAGYLKDASFPKTISVARNTATNVSATNPRLFKVIVLVCRQHDSTLYPSAITIDGASAGTSLSAAGASTAGLSVSALCGLTDGDASGLRAAPDASNPHSASISIPNSQGP